MGKEKLIGAVIGILVTVIGGLLSLSTDTIKEGICGGASVIQK